jgi:hypothetical protein
MFAWYPIQDPLRNLATTVSRMRRTSWPFAPVSATLAISSTQTQAKDSSDISSNTSTGHPWRWFRPASKSQPRETSPDRCCGTDRSHSRSSASDTQTLFETLSLSFDTQGYRTPLTDRIVSNLISATQSTENCLIYGVKNNSVSLEPLEKPTLGLSLMA